MSSLSLVQRIAGIDRQRRDDRPAFARNRSAGRPFGHRIMTFAAHHDPDPRPVAPETGDDAPQNFSDLP